MRFVCGVSTLALTACALGCSGTPNATLQFGSGGDGGGGGSLGSPDGGGRLTSGSDGGSAAQDNCSAAAKLVYVVDEGGGLHSFDPSTLTFSTIGTLSCPGGAGINSMAVDRTATAWVNDQAGNVFKVSTSTASCGATGFQVGQHGFTTFGMGFSADTDGGTGETLYLDGNPGIGLGSLDLSNMTITPIGNFNDNLGSQQCELTGTGDGRLFGFFTTTPATVSRIDKQNATILSSAPQAGVDTGTDWAFSFWGGKFYLYTADIATNPNDTSDVTLYDPTLGTTTVVLRQIGFRIVGAGVSTCAPVTAPPAK